MLLSVILKVSLIVVPIIVYKFTSLILSVLFDPKDKTSSKSKPNRCYVAIPDTSWLMEIGKSKYNLLVYLIQSFESRRKKLFFLIHTRVMKELDGLKNNKEKALQARRAIKFIEEVYRDFPGKIKITSLRVNSPYKKFRDGLVSEVDAIVLTFADRVKKRISSQDSNTYVILLSTDKNQRILAQNSNIQSFGQDFSCASC